MKVWGITGWKNTGKTTLTERLVAHFTASGLTVSTIKHAHHDTDVDQPGRDSYRHRAAGASEVIVASPNRWALMHELRGADEPPFEDLLAHLSPVDLVLVEGYKRGPHPKIETHRATTGRDLMAPENNIRAVASDVALPDLGLPVFDLNDIDAIAAYIRAQVSL